MIRYAAVILGYLMATTASAQDCTPEATFAKCSSSQIHFQDAPSFEWKFYHPLGPKAYSHEIILSDSSPLALVTVSADGTVICYKKMTQKEFISNVVILGDGAGIFIALVLANKKSCLS